MKATPPHQIRLDLDILTPSFARNDATYKKAALAMLSFTQVPRRSVLRSCASPCNLSYLSSVVIGAGLNP